MQQFAATHLHAAEGKPPFAKVFDAGTEVIDRFINTKETVMRAVERYDTYRRILSIVLLNIQLQLCGWFLGINGNSHLVCSFGEHGEHAIIDIVVNEDDACGGFAYAVVDEGVGIEDLPVVEDALVGLHITAILTTEDLLEFVVCLCLVRHKCQLVLLHHI